MVPCSDRFASDLLTQAVAEICPVGIRRNVRGAQSRDAASRDAPSRDARATVSEAANPAGRLAPGDRRRFLTQAGIAATYSVLASLDAVGSRAEFLLQKAPVNTSMLVSLKNEVRQMGYSIRTTDPHVFLRQAVRCFSALQRLLEQRQPVETQRRLRRELAKLGGLIAIDTNAVGDAEGAHEWFRLADSLAREGGDDQIRAWVIAYEAMSHLWHGRMPVRALELAGHARRLAGDVPTPSAALAAAIEARAYARLGRPFQAMKSLEAAEALWTSLDAQVGQEETTFGFYEQLLRMYQSDVLTVLGTHVGDAYAAQERAIALAPTGGGLDVDTALVLLDRATCYAKEGELGAGAQLAADTLERMPGRFRAGTASQRAQNIVDLAVSGGGARLVAQLEELLRTH